VFALMGRVPTIDVDHVNRFLVNGYKSLYKQPHEFFSGLEAIPAASWLCIDREGHESTGTYWSPVLAPDDSLTFDDAVAEARVALLRAVELRLRADVPLAFCMSGGVDSNALISIAKRVFGYDVHGFTITNTDARYEESAIVEAAVRELQIRHTPVKL